MRPRNSISFYDVPSPVHEHAIVKVDLVAPSRSSDDDLDKALEGGDISVALPKAGGCQVAAVSCSLLSYLGKGSQNIFSLAT